MKPYLLLSFLLIYNYNIITHELTGKVTDKTSSEELAGVMVIINYNDTTYSDFDGTFKIKYSNIKTIDLKYPSYQSGKYYFK